MESAATSKCGVKLQITLGRAFIIGFGFMLRVMAGGGLIMYLLLALITASVGGG